MYPIDSLQGLLGEKWWEDDKEPGLRRGKLVWSEVLFYTQIPFEVLATRSDDREHISAELETQAMQISGRRKRWPDLPVAGLPRLDGADCFLIQRAKIRPCLVLGGLDSRVIPRHLRVGMPKWMSTSHCLAAPFYTADQAGRAGASPEMVEKIRHATFSQFFVDQLPLENSSKDSILRFDQVFPLGNHPDAYSNTGYCLSDKALELMEEWFLWYLQGTVHESTMLELFFQHLENINNSANTGDA